MKAFLFLTVFVFFGISHAASVHGFSLVGDLKYPKGFKHFDYTNPKAPKGGTLRLGTVSAFDTLNPFVIKGTAPSITSSIDTVFETLTVASFDEASTEYGLLAESMELAKDRLSITYNLRKEARFSDGKPVTAEDVKFSIEKVLSDEAKPFYKAYYGDVKTVKVINKHKVKILFKKLNPELHMILGQLSILPKHVYGKGDFTKDFTAKAVGSGPYVVEKFEPGKQIILRRNKNYWGAKVNVNIGKWNYDEMVMKVFRDPTIWLEGLKADEFDFAAISSSKQWAVDTAGDKWKKNWIKKELLGHGGTQGMQGFVMNLRRPIFQSRNVRQAIATVFDFDWANKTLFYNQYTQQSSYFDNSVLRANGLPSKEELALLTPLKGQIPDEVFTQELKPIGKGLNQRARLLAAKKLLDADGWKIKNGVMSKGDQQLKFEFMLTSPAWERIVEPFVNNLKKLGIKAELKVVDRSIAAKREKSFDYDVILDSFGQSTSPGNEQIGFWHSSSADKTGSRNTIGIKDPAIDKLVDHVVKAPNREALITATRALDRVLWFGYYVVPNWYIDSYRITYWNRLDLPSVKPKHFNPVIYFVNHSWLSPEKDKKLTKAMKEKKAF